MFIRPGSTSCDPVGAAVPVVAPRELGAVIDAEVLVVGAGIVGLVLGIGLARLGLDVVLAGKVDARLPGRTVALLNGSIAFLDRLGLWSALVTASEPLRVMRIVDDRGSLFGVPPVTFRAEEIGEAWFGRNIENRDLVERLAAIAGGEPRLRMLDQHLEGFIYGSGDVRARLDDGRVIQAQVVAASDGRGSPARQSAGLKVEVWRYPQTAITAILGHDRPHGGISTEFHTRQGPFTLVPLPGSPGAPHRSSLVWVVESSQAERLCAMAPETVARDIERQSRRLLGRVALEGPVGSFPITGLISERMTASRLALAGEASHVMPPIGAQGLNLGLRDAAALVEIFGAARRARTDLGERSVLERYEAARRGDVAARVMAIDRLNRSLLSGFVPLDLARGAALTALAHVGPLRRLAMRAGLWSGA